MIRPYDRLMENAECNSYALAEKIYQLGRADAIEEYRKEMHDIIEGDDEFTDWQKHEFLGCCEVVAEQLKEKKNERL